MFDTAAVSALSEVTSWVLGDREGGLLEAVEEPESETMAAISGFTVSHLAEAAEGLGLGRIEGLTIAGGGQTSILAINDKCVLTARVDARGSVAKVESKIEKIMQSGEDS